MTNPKRGDSADLTLTVACAAFPEANGSHGNPYAKNRLVQTWRTLATIEARRLHLTPARSPVTIDVQVHRPSNRHSDATNAFWAIKAVIDALVTERILAGDCDCYIKQTTIRRGPKTKTPALTITITEA